MILPRRKALRLPCFDYSSKHVYFITICALRKANLFTEVTVNKDIVESLTVLRAKYKIKLFCYCLMPNHLHLLIQPFGDRSISNFIAEFKFISCKIANRRLWQRSFYDHIVRSEEDLTQIVQYTLANPVRKGIVDEVCDFPFGGTIDDLP